MHALAIINFANRVVFIIVLLRVLLSDGAKLRISERNNIKLAGKYFTASAEYLRDLSQS